MTPDELSKWSITHKSRKTLKTQQTILVGTSSIPNKSQEGRHTAKQGVFCSQYRFLLLSLFIGGLNHNLQKSLKTDSRSQTSTNAQHRANNPVGYTLVFRLQIAHRVIHGETGRSPCCSHKKTVVFFFIFVGVAVFVEEFEKLIVVDFFVRFAVFVFRDVDLVIIRH